MNPIVIKAPAVSGTVGAIIKKETYLSQRRAEQILQDAHLEAVRVVEAAHQQRASVVEAARQEGYADGLAEWNEILVRAWKSHNELIVHGESELVRMAIRIARKIIGEELSTKADAILGIVREALRSVWHARTLRIRVSPEDELTVREKVDSFRSVLGNTVEITVFGDPAVGRGGCIVESDAGIIDAQLETQLSSFEKALLGRAPE
jgi:type III secretion protein L